jgi:DNA-binding SARP family transcriptional activator/pimeloyl-ACP methyl ester carboxylesterase
MVLAVRLLGPFSVEVDGQQVLPEAWERRDAVALVKVLALAREHALHRERVIDALWPDVDPIDAGPRLHKAAHFARKALGRTELLRLRNEIVVLGAETEVLVDALALEDQAATALTAGSPHAAGALLDRFPGEPLPEDLYASWADEPRQRLTTLRRRLLRQALRWRDLADLDPTDEEASVALMREHLDAGDRQGALRVYEALDRALRRELGVQPAAEATALREEVRAAMRAEGVMTSADERRLEQRIRFCRTHDGVTLGYAASGSGPPLVKAANWLTHLDHDWHSLVWKHWLLELSRDHELFRFDQRGGGLSDRDIRPATFTDWVHDLEAVVDAAGLDRFPLLGISQGGPVAMAYAARHPERVSRLVLYGTYVQGRLVRATSQDQRREHALQVELVRLGWGRDEPAFRQVFTSQFMPGADRRLWDDFNELQRRTTSAETAARVLEVTGEIDVTATAQQVQAPTLVLHARSDLRPPFEQGRLTASLIPDSRFVALDSRNHILLADEPAWPVFLREVRAFLSG